MEFKELFGSFTSHWDEKRITGSSNGSTGSLRHKKQKTQARGAIADASRAVGDALW
ncbi:hypothetical protein Hanom_Chr10g00901141 [Helianthus anomalus]